MVRWMCGVKLQDRVPSKGLRERLGLDDHDRCEWVNVSSGTGSPSCPGQNP